MEKTSDLEKQKVLRSHMRLRDPQFPRVFWQPPTNGLRIPKFEKKLNLDFLKIFLNTRKKVISRNHQKKMSGHKLRQDSQPSRVLWQPPTNALGILKIEEENFSFLKIFWNRKNVISRNLQRNEQSNWKTKFVILEDYQTGPIYRVGSFRFWRKIKFSKFFDKIPKNVFSRKPRGFEQ